MIGSFEELSAEIVERVERALPGWVDGQVRRIVDAWGRLAPDVAAQTAAAAAGAGDEAAARIGAALRAVMALDAADQRATPLQIVRDAYREPTAVLAAAGIPPVERDAFHEERWPDDAYGLVPEHLADLGDDDLGPLLLAWGLAKARRLHPPD